jgi:hypothetical protein
MKQLTAERQGNGATRETQKPSQPQHTEVAHVELGAVFLFPSSSG